MMRIKRLTKIQISLLLDSILYILRIKIRDIAIKNGG